MVIPILFKKATIVLIATHFIVSCSTNKSGGSTKKNQICGNNSSVAALSSKKPDQTTYFPLLPGSYWKTGHFVDGTMEANSCEVDSVVALGLNKNEYCATVVHFTVNEPKVDTIRYIVDCNGFVFTNRYGVEHEFFAKLFPAVGDTLHNLSYSHQCQKGPDCIQFDSFNYDSAQTEKQQATWQFKEFRKGMGVYAWGGSASNTMVTEFRIGINGKVIKP